MDGWIEILLPVSILITSPYSACHSALSCRISSKSVHPQRRYNIISIFKMAAAAAQFYFWSGFKSGDVALFGCQFLTANQI